MDGRISPTSTFHISRAYGLRPPMRVRPLAGAPTVARLDPAQRQEGVGRLVAAVVDGRIDFGGVEPVQDGAALAMYRHPADKNAAATGVSAGRMLDVTG
jgi:hypothetical protein